MNDTVTISRREYEDLMESKEWLDCLDAAGVDNWHGIELAMDIRAEMRREEV